MNIDKVAGKIIFNSDLTQVVTVTIKTNKTIGLPKGKREGKETTKETSDWETQEETGIHPNQLLILGNPPSKVTEYKENNVQSCVYFVCRTKNDEIKLQCLDQKENLIPQMMKIEDFLNSDKVLEARKVCVKSALHLAQEYKDQFNSDETILIEPRVEKPKDLRKLAKLLRFALNFGKKQKNLLLDENGYVKIQDLLEDEAFKDYSINDFTKLAKQDNRFHINDTCIKLTEK